jgi:hypothetical protein
MVGFLFRKLSTEAAGSTSGGVDGSAIKSLQKQVRAKN